ncbi:MAG: hypothetical protein NVS3B21_16940 [Acidimicrobiales bacterium]
MAKDDRVERAGGVRSRGGTAAAPRIVRRPGVKSPSPVALEYAEDVAARVSSRPVPVRNGFIERLDSASTDDPPLATLLRGGQGGAVRLKLLLSMLWFAVRAPHETSYPARGWAGLLGLDQYETNGARRITAAIDWLEANNLVRVVRSPGVPSKVFLLDERATAATYELPFAALTAKREAGEALDRDDLYVTLPSDFFTKGWIAVLGAPAVAMLLVMVLEARFARRTRGLWHSPSQADRRFGLSQDTRSTGLQELELYGIVVKRTMAVSPGVFDMKRRRNIYDLHLEQLLVAPGQPRPTEELTPEDLDPAGADAVAPASAGSSSEPAVADAPDAKAVPAKRSVKVPRRTTAKKAT